MIHALKMLGIMLIIIFTTSKAEARPWFRDSDRDGYGTPRVVVNQPMRPPGGFVARPGDCNDRDAAINPAAAEIWYDGVDQNCDRLSDLDQDGDGYDSLDLGGGDDCDDTNELVYPGQIVNVTVDLTYSTIQDAIDTATDGDTIYTCEVTDTSGIEFYGRNNLTLDGFGLSGVMVGTQSCIMIQDSTGITISGFDLAYCQADGTVLVPDGSQDNDKGGGIWIKDSSNITLIEVIVEYNYSLDSGGGLYINNSSVLVDDSTLAANDADDSGGNVHIRGDSTVEFIDGSIIDAPDHNGVFIDDSGTVISASFTGVWFWDNTSSDIVMNSGNTYAGIGDYTGTCDYTGSCS